MNKVILMGRLTRDPEIRYAASNICIARYTLALNRRFKKDGEPDADFINCVAFGKNGEFAEKYLKKGMMISIVGCLQVRSWDDNDGKRHWTMEVVIDEHYFAESKKTSQTVAQTATTGNDGFYPIDESVSDEDLPF